MNSLVEKFNQIYNNKPTKLKVKFFEDEPFTVRNARYNQGGIVCYCMQGQTKGKQKLKNVWQEKECLETCEYAISKNNQKPACSEEGTLKFLLPEISNDRVWLMKIRGITVIDKISNYISSQKLLGNSMVGEFYLYLKQEEHIRQSDGQKFTNYTIDILKTENLNESTQAQVENIPEETVTQEKTNNTLSDTKKEPKTKKKSKKETPTQKEDADNKVVELNSNTTYETVSEGEYSVDECYFYMSQEPLELINKGNKLNYTLAKFIDSNDKEVSAIVNQKLASELSNCDLGTIVLIETIKKADYLWVTSFKYVQQMLKVAV